MYVREIHFAIIVWIKAVPLVTTYLIDYIGCRSGIGRQMLSETSAEIVIGTLPLLSNVPATVYDCFHGATGTRPQVHQLVTDPGTTINEVDVVYGPGSPPVALISNVSGCVPTAQKSFSIEASIFRFPAPRAVSPTDVWNPVATGPLLYISNCCWPKRMRA